MTKYMYPYAVSQSKQSIYDTNHVLYDLSLPSFDIVFGKQHIFRQVKVL